MRLNEYMESVSGSNQHFFEYVRGVLDAFRKATANVADVPAPTPAQAWEALFADQPSDDARAVVAEWLRTNSADGSLATLAAILRLADIAQSTTEKHTNGRKKR